MAAVDVVMGKWMWNAEGRRIWIHITTGLYSPASCNTANAYQATAWDGCIHLSSNPALDAAVGSLMFISWPGHSVSLSTSIPYTKENLLLPISNHLCF